MEQVITRPKNYKKFWTPEQEEILLESYGIAGMQYLMDRLGKSADAIQIKYYELTGTKSIHKSAGTLTAREVADALGVSHNTLIDWINNADFPASQKFKMRKESKRRVYSIDPEKVWSWVAKNKKRINFAHIQRRVILPEPAWVEEEVKKALQKPLKRPKNWTFEEDEQAWKWWQEGVNFREIARRLKRPIYGTQRRLTAIKKRKQGLHETKR
ncbi:hypothetical protein [Cytobacillus oceanisediminis]|uniref:hypothetical protein n=1 Tax=Cytobacillus oceanisediminis TaxID=665099 RepID=UPI001FB44B30|nr:hypothetical protein [Cytobacillus oceanisediminis]UOE58007.1 hypothetical protein IRB79_27465 [Cytobacillus oceanisediminis]